MTDHDLRSFTTYSDAHIAQAYKEIFSLVPRDEDLKSYDVVVTNRSCENAYEIIKQRPCFANDDRQRIKAAMRGILNDITNGGVIISRIHIESTRLDIRLDIHLPRVLDSGVEGVIEHVGMLPTGNIPAGTLLGSLFYNKILIFREDNNYWIDCVLEQEEKFTSYDLISSDARLEYDLFFSGV